MCVFKIHIDGHSDMAMPFYDPKMPFFRWPNTMDQMHHMMQANDVFIQVGNNNYQLMLECSRPSIC